MTDDGVLTIYGTGSMQNSNSASATPWYSYRDSITSLVVEEGVTYVGFYALNNVTNLTKEEV